MSEHAHEIELKNGKMVSVEYYEANKKDLDPVAPAAEIKKQCEVYHANKKKAREEMHKAATEKMEKEALKNKQR